MSFRQVANWSLIAWGGFLFVMQMHELQQSYQDKGAIAASNDATNVGTSAGTGAPSGAQTAWKDEIKITIAAKWELEYKFRMKKDAKLEYVWETDGGKLFFDFHGEPKGDTTGYFKSYKESTDNKSSGALTAPFEGIHGWYWKNQTNKPVVVTLKARGDYARMDK